jgi:8-oxo-dGTP pyrophosphatase MutT (NUDIX family)
MPGGASEVGEPPSRTAEREAAEETGLAVRATRLLGVYDNLGYLPVAPVHMYHLVFECDWIGGAPVVTGETSDVRWADRAEALALPLFRVHARKVPEAFEMHERPDRPARFD